MPFVFRGNHGAAFFATEVRGSMAYITSSLSLSAKAAISGRKVTLGNKRGASRGSPSLRGPVSDAQPGFSTTAFRGAPKPHF
jgi:hypothetical protein